MVAARSATSPNGTDSLVDGRRQPHGRRSSPGPATPPPPHPRMRRKQQELCAAHYELIQLATRMEVESMRADVELKRLGTMGGASSGGMARDAPDGSSCMPGRLSMAVHSPQLPTLVLPDPRLGCRPGNPGGST